MLGNNKLVTLVAAILSLCLMGMLLFQGVQKAQADPFSPGSKSYLDIQLSDDAGDVTVSDLGLWYKLYKVANVEQQAGYDAYEFEFITNGLLDIAYKGDIEALNSITASSDDSAEKYKALANAAAEAIYNAQGSVSPAYNLEANGSQAGVDYGVLPGLYLVVPYGSNTIPEGSPADTNVLVPNDSKSAPYPYVSKAYTETQKFTFNPQLLALPTTNTLNSADPTGWNYNPTITLKPSIEPRKGSLTINKLISAGEYNNDDIGNNQVTFVFDIKGYTDEAHTNLAYTNVASIVINTKDGNSGSATIDGIPAGLYIVVTERYTGNSYEAVTKDGQTTQIVATDSTLIDDGTANATVGAFVDFENTYNGTGNKGGSVTNTFAMGENGGWEWIKNGESQGGEN